MEELVKKIRSDLRLAMNGVISTSMRDKGMDYRMNFGVDLPKLREMAKRYVPDGALAAVLWHTETRELKILATMLRPAADFSKGEADKWASEISNQEIREQVCMNLFQKLDFADELVRDWIWAEDENMRATGFWLFARLSISKSPVLDGFDGSAIVDRAILDLPNPSVFVRQSALNALKRAGRGDSEMAKQILERLSLFLHSENPMEREIFDALRFEFEYVEE